jgi:MgtC family
VRLPLAAALGAALALRPRRRGTPRRDPAVIQTQIILAVVGAVIMLVVGASLARAFGIVGAANLIRYRSKIDDPKDAVVMLCTLAVGLASGVGLYALAAFSTLFIGAALWVIESFEQGMKRFDLRIKAGKDTDALRPKFEEILRRYDLKFELRTSSDEEVCYDVQVPLEFKTDRISNAILRLDPEGHGAVEWADKKAKSK